MVEEIKWKDELLAIVIRGNFSTEGVNFVTHEDSSLQVGVLKHRQGERIKPHIHKQFNRTITETQEVLHLVYGKVEAQLYHDRQLVNSCILFEGDTIALLKGGHGFNVLEDSKIIEVKQGPFVSVEDDKELL